MCKYCGISYHIDKYTCPICLRKCCSNYIMCTTCNINYFSPYCRCTNNCIKVKCMQCYNLKSDNFFRLKD